MVKSDASKVAQEALNLVLVDPGRSVRLARTALRWARAGGQLDAASVAERTLGLASLHLQELSLATRHLRFAIDHAELGGFKQLAAEARMSYAFALNRSGKAGRALSEIGVALADLSPRGHAEGLAQRGAILQQLGRLDEALADYRAALPALRRGEDWVWVQRVHLNRGALHAFRHNYGAAARDLQEAEKLCNAHGLTLSAAFVQENLGLVSRRIGDVPGALRHLDAAEALYTSLGAPFGSLLVERSEVLLSAGLFPEARDAAERAVAEFSRTGRKLGIPEARLLLARTAVLTGEPARAVAEASRAVREFGRQGRAEWVALARGSLLLVRAEGQAAAVSVRRVVEVAEAVEAAGWPATATDLRLLAGRRSPSGRRSAVSREQLERISATRHRGIATQRAKGWLATALLRQDSNNRRGSSAAARRGLEVLDDYRATMVATDLRAHVSRLGAELAKVGLRNALAAGSADQLLTWAERWRARHLLERPALPPEDPAQASLLAELRALVAEQSADLMTPARRAEVNRRQLWLERAIRDSSRRQNALLPSPSRTLSLAALKERLGAAVLVEFVEVDGTLYGVALAEGRTTFVTLGSLDRVRELVRWVQFGLRRMVRGNTVPESGRAAVEMMRRTGQELGHILLDPLSAQLGSRPAVIVPTGILQSTPWTLLPPLRGRSYTVSPSATLWAAAQDRPARDGTVTVVAGPGLPGAREEAAAVAAVHGTKPLIDQSATVASVAATLSTATLLHIAAHGNLRADNPLFSSLQLADGPLTVYELERLETHVDTVVLAACESGRDVVLAGDELLGLSAAFLSRRTRNIVASVVPIPDAETGPLMVALHEQLASGVPVATALAHAQELVDPEDIKALAAAAGFVCIGAGFPSGPAPGSG